MPWPPRQPLRAEIKPEDVEAYDMVVERARRMGFPNPDVDASYYGHLMLAPQIGNHQSEMGKIFRALGDKGDSYTHADREFVDQILGKDLQTNIVQATHLNDAVSTGVRIEACEAVFLGQEENLTAEEAQLADFIRKTRDGQMDKATYEKMEARMGEKGALEYALFILYLQLTMRAMAITGFVGPTDEELGQEIAAIKAGQKEIDDYRKRIT